jgi:hypothetical protein
MTLITPTDIILEIPSTVPTGQYSNPVTAYQGYINKLCLDAILPWIQQDIAPQTKIWTSTTALPSFWELVNGTVIILDDKRLVLVPSEAIDLSEMRVPQEWVDIPTWAGDYYLAVQIEPDDGYVRVWGYCTHEQLKTQGNYNPSDRTYAMDSDFMNDISTLSVAQQYIENTRSHITELPSLPLTQAQNLISRLSNPDTIIPRLTIPFEMWGALIQHGGWRLSLYQRRLGQPENFSIIQWLQTGVSEIAQNIGWRSFDLLQSGARNIEALQQVEFSRQLTIAGQTYQLTILPENQTEATICRFELFNTIGALIPNGFKLRLLTEDLQPFPNNEDVATNPVQQLFVEVALSKGEGIVWEIEPIPENYDREILKF